MVFRIIADQALHQQEGGSSESITSPPSSSSSALIEDNDEEKGMRMPDESEMDGIFEELLVCIRET